MVAMFISSATIEDYKLDTSVWNKCLQKINEF